ncbi:hypothetical protein [Kitasatospora sp. NPDC088134]|uniref:hypothetical protein n=1 Tax=Kitasatospora sp. NPDC088134 TaxID=3364071 RepID=UPI00382BF1DC
MFRHRRRSILNTIDLMQQLNASLRRHRDNWRRSRFAGCPLDGPSDLQQQLTAAFHDHTRFLSDMTGLAVTARASLPDTPETRAAQEELDWAVFLTGQVNEALRSAALATCPDYGGISSHSTFRT